MIRWGVGKAGPERVHEQEISALSSFDRGQIPKHIVILLLQFDKNSNVRSRFFW